MIRGGIASENNMSTGRSERCEMTEEGRIIIGVEGPSFFPPYTTAKAEKVCA